MYVHLTLPNFNLTYIQKKRIINTESEGNNMKFRIDKKHTRQWQQPFHDAIAHYNAKTHHCKRWRNRRKAQKQYNDRIWREYKND